MLSLLFAICMIWFIGKFFIFGIKNIVGNSEIALYSSILSRYLNGYGCWWTDVY